MVAALAGDQWNEGDVSCSVVRRVALPDAFFATDGLFETFLTVLDDFGAYPAVIERELERYLPFLATTKVLVAAVRRRRRPRGGARGDQGARRRRRRSRCARRAPRATTCSTASPPTTGSGSSRADLDGVVADPLSFVGTAPAPGRARSSAAVATTSSRRRPRRRRLRAAPIL